MKKSRRQAPKKAAAPKKPAAKAGNQTGTSECAGTDWHTVDWCNKPAMRYLCPPDGTPDFCALTQVFGCPGSPSVTPFKDPLFVPPVKEPLTGDLEPPSEPCHHQRYEEFKPQVFYELREREFLWQFHSDYGRTTWTWGYCETNSPRCDKSDPPCHITPGPTFHARYGEPILVRRYNELPSMLISNVHFALPSTTTHNHNGHQASESDGDPSDWIDTGDVWDHHYPNFPATRMDLDTCARFFDEREKLTTLWYHDHRLDFTAANVYAGLVGFYLLFDGIETIERQELDDDGKPVKRRRLAKAPQDVGIESAAELRAKVREVLGNDLNGEDEELLEQAWRLPSGEHDVPLILHDLLFDENCQLVFDGFNTHGVIGDRFTVNRIIQPNFQVERRKYRFRILNGGPSRFYQIYLHVGEHDSTEGMESAVPRRCDEPEKEPQCIGQYDEPDDPNQERDVRFILISGDGNLLQEPVEACSIFLGVAQRVDVIIDFGAPALRKAKYIYLENRLEQHHGHGPSGRLLTVREAILQHRLMRFEPKGRVVETKDLPDFFREPPPIDLSLIKREREWTFDYDGGIWTVNGNPMRPDYIDAGIEQDSAEIWTYRNDGTNWWHPIHSHLMEWIVMEVNGIPVLPGWVQIDPNPKNLCHFQHVFKKTGYSGPYIPGTNVLDGPFCGGTRRDIANLGPRTEITLFSRWPDFFGKYVLHCHNVVHEDYAMMIRWEVLPAGRGFQEPRKVVDVYGIEEVPRHIETRPAHAMMAHGSRPYDPQTMTPRLGPAGLADQQDSHRPDSDTSTH